MSMIGRPSMIVSHSCAEVIFLLSGKFTMMVFLVTCLFSTLALSMIKKGDALVSAIV